MRKALTFLGASLCLAWVVPAFAQAPPDTFKDVDRSHWAYDAVESLRSKGILIGYPDGYFRGKRTLTRYEFAVALDRALKTVTGGGPGGQGERGLQGEKGEKGDVGPPGMTPEEVQTLRRLTQEFRDELASLGNNVNAINRRLDQLAKDVDDIKAQLAKMPKIGGDVFFGVRADRAGHAFSDIDGRARGKAGLLNTPDVVHQFRLTVNANIPGGATLAAGLTTDNYKNYLSSNEAQVLPAVSAPPSDTYLDQLEIRAPFGGLGRESSLTLGRFGERVSRLTFWKPDVDSYFNLPWVDDGAYRIDGVRFDGHFGSAFLEAFGGQTMSVTGTNGMAWNSPLAGASSPAVFAGRTKPTGQPLSQGQLTVDQVVGVSVGANIRQLQGGHFRVTALDASAKRAVNTINNGGTFTQVQVLGADFDLKLTDRITLTGDWGKANTARARFDTVNAGQNNAFNVTAGYNSGPLNLMAGYRYIDPLFYAPGYWGRIGNWLNPTNVQGPTFRAGYDFSPSFGVNVGGDFYSTARNRGGGLGSLGEDDEIHRILVGLRWDIAKNFRTTVDWEGVYWNFSGSAGSGLPGAGKVHPTEHYITLGTGYNLTSNTLLKLMYQIGDFNGHGALNSGSGFTSNFNTFASQVAVRF